MVEEKKSKNGREFIFLGANAYAAEAAESMGISEKCAAKFKYDSANTDLNFSVPSDSVANVRACPSASTDGTRKKAFNKTLQKEKNKQCI